MSLVVDEHREYLKDAVRVDAFRTAILERVRPGDVIVDLGAGTGILGLLACEAGAARVYAIESTGMIEVAQAIARANGHHDKIVPVQRLSTQAELPEPADGIVCDQIGQFGFEAGLFETLADARRFLKPGGWTLPQQVAMEAAPVEDAEIRARIDFWNEPVAGLDFTAARPWAANTGYPKHLDERQFLGPAATVAQRELLHAPGERIAIAATLKIDRAGRLDGIGGWFRARLSPSVELTNAPHAARRLTRRNVVLPLAAAVDVEAGDTVALRLQIMPADLVVSWRGEVRTRAGATPFSQSTWGGMLVTRAELRRLDPGNVPKLTARGLARRTVLDLCDRRRTLAEIEREVWERHRDLFKSSEEASVFVAEVVSRYTE